MNKSKLIALLCCGLLIYNNAVADINSATITEATAKALPNCLHFRVIGMCIWFSPYTGYSETPLVEHYLPDVVVNVFNKPGDNPWTEMNASIDQAGKATEEKIVTGLSHDDAGSGQHSYGDIQEQNTFFKEADIVGNPGLTVTAVQPELLPSTATPLFPYYQSMFDAAMWRGFPDVPPALAEEALAMGANFKYHIGTDLINWGGLYPHEGKVATTNDAKAAAVIAQRAGDIITAINVPGHVYQPLLNECGQHCKAAPIQINSPKTQFQMISPKEEDSCDYFGKTLTYGEEAERDTKGAYSWIIWRYYRGCRDGAGKFVQEITF